MWLSLAQTGYIVEDDFKLPISCLFLPRAGMWLGLLACASVVNKLPNFFLNFFGYKSCDSYIASNCICGVANEL